MSTTAKVALIIVIIAVVAGGAYWWLAGQNNASAPSAPPSGSISSNTAANAQPTLTSGNSNADLNQDLATINAQMNGFATDSASMSQSLNDQPVSQSQL